MQINWKSLALMVTCGAIAALVADAIAIAAFDLRSPFISMAAGGVVGAFWRSPIFIR